MTMLTSERAPARLPGRRPNREMRPREYLTENEVETLCATARKHSRYGRRDSTMVLIAFRHALRASEVCNLQWGQIDLDGAWLHVSRIKNGIDTVHPLTGVELRALRRLKNDAKGNYVFGSERGGPMTRKAFFYLVTRLGVLAGMPFKIHPHMLRHAAGFKLANDGRDTRTLQHFMGHKNIMHTVRYTEMAPGRFKDFWRD